VGESSPTNPSPRAACRALGECSDGRARVVFYFFFVGPESIDMKCLFIEHRNYDPFSELFKTSSRVEMFR
jgi:hypothetical protein